MSIISNMCNATLLTLSEETDFYGKPEGWQVDTPIDISIFKKSGSTYIGDSLLTSQSTHIGITDETDIDPKTNRIMEGNKVYSIDDVVIARKTILFLKAVE